MRVVSVQMRDFRSYARAEAALGEGLTVVYGPNGAGKSNLLEAIYFGCTARSPRTRNERELVRFGEQAARVVVALADGPARARAERGLRDRAGERGSGQADDLRRSARRAAARRGGQATDQRVRTRPAGAPEGIAGPAPRPSGPGRGGGVATARERPPGVFARARAAQRPARADPRGAGVAGDAVELGPRARGQGRRASRRPRRDGRTARRAVRPSTPRSWGAAASLRSSIAPARGRPARTSSSPSCRSGWRAISSAASRATDHTATSSRSCATDASSASTAPRENSVSRCWRCCSPSAPCWRANAGACR